MHLEPHSPVSTQTPHVLVTGVTGFVGQAWKTNRDGSAKFNEWVTIDRAGRLHQVAHQPDGATPAQPPRPGDIRICGPATTGGLMSARLWLEFRLDGSMEWRLSPAVPSFARDAQRVAALNDGRRPACCPPPPSTL